MNKNHNEANAGTNAITTFVKSFGPDDIYTSIILEVLFEELLLKSNNNEIKSNETEIKNDIEND
jgi:hypothetical protein